MVTDLNDPNETVMFSRSIIGNFWFEIFFGELEAETYPLVDPYKQSELLHSNQIAKLNCKLVDYSNDASVDSSHCTLVNSSFTNYCTQLTNHNLWTLYFDTSRNTHGVDDGCFLVDPYGIWTYLSCFQKSIFVCFVTSTPHCFLTLDKDCARIPIVAGRWVPGRG